MTRRQKFIAGCINPHYGKFATREEVKIAKRLAKQKYWIEDDYSQYVSYSPTGLRMFFEYDDKIKSIARKAARLWANGKYKESKSIYNSSVDKIDSDTYSSNAGYGGWGPDE